MAVQRLLYSQQTCIISCGGYLKDTNPGGNPDYSWQINDDLVHNSTKNILGYAKHAHDETIKDLDGDGVDETYTTNGGFKETRNWLLPVQSFSADETIPAEDVLVMGNKSGVHRSQTNVASGKCSVKAYLAEYMSFKDGSSTKDAGVLQWYQHTTSTTDAATETEKWVGTMAKDGFLDATAATAGNYPDGVNVGDVESDGTTPSLKDTDSSPNVGADLQQFVSGNEGPFPGITQKGYLAGEAWIQNGASNVVSQGMLEQLIWEAMGGFEALVQIFNPTTDTGINKMDGVSFIGILSSIGIDASKGGYPTLDLSFESVGQLPFINMGTKNQDGSDISLTVAHADDWYVKSCSPHTSQDVLVWGRDQWGGTETGFTNDELVLLASNEQNFWSEDAVVKQANTGLWTQPDLDQGSGAFGNTANRYGGGSLKDATFTQGDTDVLNSAKLSLDLPTETLSALGNEVKGNTYEVRHGNRVFSKPPYKASLNLDGQGLKAAGLETVHSAGTHITSRVLPNEVQVGQLHCVLSPAGAGTSARSFSQNVGDVGATYSVTVEGTNASFYGTYQGLTAATANSDRDVA